MDDEADKKQEVESDDRKFAREAGERILQGFAISQFAAQLVGKARE